MNRSDISRDIAKDFAIPFSMADAIVEQVFEKLRSGLLKKQTFHLRRLGTFSVIYRKGHIGRNLKTGEPVEIKGREIVAFKAAPQLIADINGEMEK